MWVVMLLEKNIEVAVMGSEGLQSFKVPVSWADGMTGVLPVFEDMDKALEYAGNKHEIVEIKAVPSGTK